ncbi:hypothetical protein AsAng_0035160 [Aureispira anguillae]|uniref:Uncharacterized protein n=1 Tax=Aureispira anguillae TaxID=2864201 RepID=A0A916DV47_9BACT|nr:hypothetical protein AsAng_0035160 [Aureispira anguillae]
MFCIFQRLQFYPFVISIFRKPSNLQNEADKISILVEGTLEK